MSKLYSSPLRVYVLLGLAALAGLYAGLTLPISLFPNSSKPKIYVSVPFGSSTPEEFLRMYGRDFESQLKKISTDKVEIETIEANYKRREANYDLEFKWGVNPQEAEREVTQVVNSFSARLPTDIRDGLFIWLNNENSGFLAISFYSETRNLDSLYEILNPVIVPKVRRVRDALNPGLYNPNQKEVRIELNPDTMASLGLVPRQIEDAIQRALSGKTGGSLTVKNRVVQIEMPRQVTNLEDFQQIVIPTPGGKVVHLGEISQIDWAQHGGNEDIFKTSGAQSLILWAAPRPGGNVKQMSEEIIQVVKDTIPSLPADVQYRVLVDPSEFIRSAVNNVVHEVLIAALLAVGVLFLFIGSFRNVITAAIEIPLSMVLAFILMRIFGININLISLGGLALSAGMNVDASVVVMENIFRHFGMHPGPHTLQARTKILTDAVREVAFPIIASTITSLVVFLPLTMTSGLSFAILGDLAFAVVFSHGFSAIVALILVPTIRLQLMKDGNHQESHSPIEKGIVWAEQKYTSVLAKFLRHGGYKFAAYGVCVALLAVLGFAVLPLLPREIVGSPDTDWIVINVETEGNTTSRQLESKTDEIERETGAVLKDRLAYTFTHVQNANRAQVMARLKDKATMQAAWTELESRFQNTPFLKFRVSNWNPSELPIPDPPHLRLVIYGNDIAQRNKVTKEISDLFEERKLYSRLWERPNVSADSVYVLSPISERWSYMRDLGVTFTPSDLADLSLVATRGRKVADFPMKSEQLAVVLRFPDKFVNNAEEIGALPIGMGSKIVPLKALAEVKTVKDVPSLFRVDLQDLALIEGKVDRSSIAQKAATLAQSKQLLGEWEKTHKERLAQAQISFSFEDAERELNEAVRELSWALLFSVLLILVTLVIQFGGVKEAIVILVSVPLGFIGVIASLYVFKSTLSLNSLLGVILLNGIAVANSIILVDFMRRLVDSGATPYHAALEAAQKRLRPIMITSLTTILGMLPIAIGHGEGGRILQPLGIAVAGGLWVSTLLTLFLVPALYMAFLESGERHWVSSIIARFRRRRLIKDSSLLMLAIVLFSSWGNAASPPASFADALTQIVERSTGAAKERAQLEGVQAKNLPASYNFFPTLKASVTQNDLHRLRENNGPATRDYAAEATLNLFRFGADISAFKAAGKEEATQKNLIDLAMIQSESQGLEALIGYLRAVREIAVHEQVTDLAVRLHDIAKERYKQGLLSAQEAERVAIDANNYRAELQDALMQRARVSAQLRALLGHEDVAADWPWRERLAKGIKIEAPLPQLENRPDWVAQRLRVEALQSRADERWGKIFPSLDLTAGYRFSEHLSSTTGNEGYWTTMLTLTVPIFEGLTDYSTYRAQVHAKTAAEADFEQVKRTAKQEWESASDSLKIAITTAQSRESTVEIARKIYTDNLRRFQRGLISVNDLAIEQNRVLTSELLAIRGWATAHSELGRLCHSLGLRVGKCLSN